MNKKHIRLGSLFTLSAALLFAPISNVYASSQYKLDKNVKIYMNADNAKRGVSSLGTYSAGNYYIYKKFNGMINVSRVAGKPGAWINPNQVKTNSKTTTVSAPKTGLYTLKTTAKGYSNAADAKNQVNQKTTLSVGDYYIYKTYNGMLNLSKKKGVPGSWVNPNIKSAIKSKVSSDSSAITKDFSDGSPLIYSLRQLQYNGIVNWSGYKFTYYSQRVLPGRGLRIPGRHVNSAGYVADKDGYIVLANSAPKGTVINTPFGFKGKVYDRGTYGNHFDVYTR